MAVPWYRSDADVFNLFKVCMALTETPELKVDACPECQFTSCLCANEAKTFEWNMTATRLDNTVSEEFPLMLPADVLEGSDQATFSVIGYQHQLLYKNDDGSYSAFGKSDNQGNTWLTVFVARSFGQASSYIYISQDHVHNALLWLQKHQLPSGCFRSVGKLFNNDLKGGVDDMISLTAYITVALVALHLEKNDTMLDNALH
ncbi:hypothetical protein AV530_012334 [Patagioenas fasciata monilis]|uniref:Alpha-macroglobulin-like TED domain-containing protein n=1 Tax=Patagioenas fasciata monilis TaxID=372326 RepID=A0A1V4JAE0_PATFA|nr:hypothetical protein AV530_012334 [Patagioenas fasciata monilis]